MAFFRQYKALFYKNVLLKARNPLGTACELLLPILFIGIMVGIYGAFKEDQTPTRQYSDPQYVRSVEPFSILPYRITRLGQRLAIVPRSPSELPLVNSFINDMTSLHPALDGATIAGSGFQHPELQALRLPGFADCIKVFNSEDELESYVTDPEYDRNWEKNSTASPKIWGALVFNRGSSRGSGDVDYSIRLNSSQTYNTNSAKVDVLARGFTENVITRYINSRLQTEGPPFLRDEGDVITIQPYPGFLTLQREIDRWLINKPVLGSDLNATRVLGLAQTGLARSIPPRLLAILGVEIFASGPRLPQFAADLGSWLQSEAYAPQQVDFVPFPVSEYKQNGFYSLVLFILSFVLVVVLSLPASRLTRGLVLEKEMKIREGMRMMGLSDAAYYAAYMTYGALFYGVLAVLIAAITCRSIFKSTDFGLVFLTFWLFGLATCTFCLLVAVFFSRAKTASALSTILYIGAYFPAFAVNPEYITAGVKRAGSLLHCTAFGLGIDLIGKWEDSGAKLDRANAAAVLNNWSLNDSLGMMVLDTILYGVLAWYIDAVLPANFREFGVPRPWYFPFTASYWREVFGLPVVNDGAAARPAPAAASSRGLFSSLFGRSAAAAPAPGDGPIVPVDASYIEEPDSNLKAKEREGRCVSVSKLRKEFSTPDGVKVAVAGVDMTMYEGQIFVLLGHNGAGKTTTISMLTGLIPPTSGTADIFGKKVLDTTQLSAIRKDLGVCPQYDVLWPELTVAEHLSIFADIKGVPLDKKAAEITKAIAEVGLTEKVRTLSSALSGGQKRKLSVCIALCGGSKVVFLDEPTSGMDPYSRRSTWQILQNAREGRVVILTTHFMDEADILGDRIAIMADGRVQCCGSPMFLKKRYGVGYILTLVKGPKCNVEATLGLLKKHVPETSVATNVGAELSLRLPLSSSPSFPAMLGELDGQLASLGVLSYGVSITSIEDVFMKISSGEGPHAVTHSAAGALSDVGHGHPTPVPMTDPMASSSTMINVASKGPAGKVGSDADPAFAAAHADPVPMTMPAALADPVKPAPGVASLEAVRAAGRAEQTGVSTFFRHFWALMVKRWQYTTRDGKALLYQLFLPGILIAIGLALIRVGGVTKYADYQLSTAQFNANARVDPNKPALPNYVPYFDFKVVDGAVVTSGDVQSVIGNIPAANISAVRISPADLSSIPDPYGFIDTSGSSSVTTVAYQMMSAHLMATQRTTAASKYGAVLFTNEGRVLNSGVADQSDIFTASKNGVTYSIFFNSTGLHTPAVFMNLVDSALYGQALGNPNARITARNHPLPPTDRQRTLFAGLLVFSAAIIMIIAFSFVASSIALFVTREREVSAKHQQFISGVSVAAYWSANFVFDLVAFYIPAVIALILCAAFRIDEFVSMDYHRRGGLILSFLLFGPALVSFTYVLTFFFKSASSASSSVLFAGVLCVILISASQFMSQIQSTCRAELGLRYVFRLIPTFAWGWNLIQLAFLSTLPLIDATCDRFSGITRPASEYEPYDALAMKANGTGLVFLAAESIVYFLVVLAIEYVLSKPRLRQYFTKETLVADPPYQDDQDVVAEAARVDAQLASGPAGITDSVVVSHLRKVYPGGKVAVKNLSYGIPVGEVFGFLGINGAGKTTTLEILSGDILPSTGTARLAGYDILTQQPQVRRLLGYCPQFEALLEFLSVREHLQLYARIKGVPEAEVPATVEAKLREMDLKQYENKLAGSLSGGNKRKLSVAIALIGSPPIVFLDEPSTGMDPVARRFMWRVISRVATEQKQCSIILTTHSMEEVEALCTRIGIMVGGRLRCLGSSQHLRDRHGQGYQVEVKLADPAPDALAQATTTMATALGGENVTSIMPSQVAQVAAALGNPARGAQVSDSGSGWAIAAAFTRSQLPGKAIPLAEFAQWWVGEEIARSVVAYICATAFPGSSLLERNGTVMRFRIISAEPLAQLFSRLEASRALGVAGFTLGQTTLEQIFVQFASQQEEEKGVARGFAGAASSSTQSKADGPQAASGASGSGADEELERIARAAPPAVVV